MSKIKKAERRLSNFNFEAEGSAVALVGTHQGGPANGVHTLITKATEQIEKADIALKMDMVDFLRTFFHMWSDEAATLAQILGYEQDWFDEDYSFEKFNTIGTDAEITLLKSASGVDKTEDSLSTFVSKLPSEDLTTLKAFAEGFNNKKQDYENMSEDIQKALDTANVDLKKAQDEAAEAKSQLKEINKAKEEANKVKYVDLAKSMGASEDLGGSMAVVSLTEDGQAVIKALEDAHTKLAEFVEKEAGFSGGQIEGGDSKETAIMKSLKAKYKKETK